MALAARLVVLCTTASGILVVALANACAPTSDEVAPPDSVASSPPRVTQVGNDAPPVTTTPSSVGPACEELGRLTGSSLTARLASPTVRSVTMPLPNRPSLSKLAVIGVGAASAVQGKTVTLGAAANANYATCDHCIVIAIGCGADCSTAAWFYPRAGSGEFSAVASAGDQSFSGVFNDVTLEEVRVDFDTSVSTPIPGGACLHVTAFTFDATTPADLQAPPTNTPADGGAAPVGSSSSSTSSGGSSTSSSTGGTGASGGLGGGGSGADGAKTTKAF